MNKLIGTALAVIWSGVLFVLGVGFKSLDSTIHTEARIGAFVTLFVGGVYILNLLYMKFQRGRDK